MIASATATKQKSALHEILTWSISRPEWQRDALRRIIEKGQLDNADIIELERISRSAVKDVSIKPAPVVADPLATAHLPAAPGSAGSVSLVSMTALQNVNRLPPGSAIPFGPDPGLTIIYGGNGAGKSSYAKVIKKACRARGTPQNITSNVFAPLTINTPASATITFKTGSTEVSALWTNGIVTDPRLANVFVFDSFSAEHYVSSDSAAAFTPYGLDVLPTLSKACDELGVRLKSDIDQWKAKINGVIANWKYDCTTAVGKCVQKLSHATREAEINTLAVLNQGEIQRLMDLRAALKADPQQKAKETRAAITRLDSFAVRIGKLATEVADEKVELIRIQLEDAMIADSTAKAFAVGQFDVTYLSGTGSDMWRSLWEAARLYSTAAYPNEEFPVVSDDARCVLCQQTLDDVANDRLSRFDAFCRDQSQLLSATAEQALSKTNYELNCILPLAPEVEKVDADLVLLTSEQRLQLLTFVANVDARLQQLKLSLGNRTWIAPVGISASPESVMRSVMTILEARAKTEESAHDPNIRKTLESEQKELEAREWLAGVRGEVLGQIERYKIITELEECDKDFKTGPITSQSTALTTLFVTKVFQDRFTDELKRLGLSTLDVVMEPVHGKKGETKFGLRLVAAGKSKVADIASEGEARCVALAAFLSELSQASHQSALVFDDPVSSLDHWHRERISERLAREAFTRQVVVFTHDAIFLNDLISFAEAASLTPKVLTLEWDNGAPGKYVQGLPWDSKRPLECLTELEQRQKIITNQWNLQPNVANAESMRHAYSRLRSTLERIVEVELLDGIVCRFESQVKSGRVRSLVGITHHECDEAKRLLQKCHNITDAHAPTMNAIPRPAELLQDITDARLLVTTIKNRKKLNNGTVSPP